MKEKKFKKSEYCQPDCLMSAIVKTMINNTHWENCFTQFQYKDLLKEAGLLLTFFLSLHNQLFLCILLSHIKEYKYLKNVIHQIDRNDWLLVSAFQQGLQQHLRWFLS